MDGNGRWAEARGEDRIKGHEAGADTAVEVLDPEALAPALAANVFNLAEVGEPGVDVLVRLATSLPGWRVRSGDLDGAVGAVRSVLG